MFDTPLAVVSWEGVRYESFVSLFSSYSYLVFYFYPKDSTSGCTVEAQEFSSLYQQFLGHKVGVFGVSKDTEKSHCRFIEGSSLTIPLIADTDLVLHDYFGTLGDKTMYGKVYKWTIRSTFVLDQSWVIVRERRDVKVAGHAKQVYDFVATLPAVL